MRVVSNTSPFVGLIKIDCVGILPALFGNILIPSEVAGELASPKRSPEIRAFIQSPPPWLVVQDPVVIEHLAEMDAGERAAINLAIQLGADVLLMDDQVGRRVALARGLKTVRTAALLFEAAETGVVPDLRAAFDRLRATNFRVPGPILDELLRVHEKRRGQAKR